MALSDSPVGPEARIKAFSHLLGECGVSILGTAEMVGKYHRGFPKSLDGAPMLLPTESTSLRRAMEEWFEAQDVRVAIAAEFADRALLKEFGQAGVGLLAAPTIIEQDVERQYRLKVGWQVGCCARAVLCDFWGEASEAPGGSCNCQGGSRAGVCLRKWKRGSSAKRLKGGHPW